MQSVKHLITEFIPSAYKLSLIINKSNKSFVGMVTIWGESVNGNISLHSKDLNITTVLVDNKPADFKHQADDELVILQPGLTNGEHIVVIGYTADITDQTHGLYASHYKQDSAPKTMLVTQLESHHAREVLPCVDEPAAKATFDVNVTCAAGLTVLSNMPVKSRVELDEDTQDITFETSPRMSTYLLAVAIGELHSLSGKTKRGVDVGVWSTTSHPKENLQFALDHAIQYIEFFEEYFGTPYPLPKCDQLALPDVSSGTGAMENWGLVTYRAECLIVDPIKTSISVKRRAALVIAHELSHQWFGNLVTMQWWNDLWLNESFATVMEYIATDKLHPEWDIWLDFANYEDVISLRRDSIDGVQSIQIDINHPDEINAIFDGAIVYAKGSRMIRMLQKYVGEPAFRAGLKQYFTDHAYQNTIGDDLWLALSKASGKDTLEFMHKWVSQPGYPVVHASLNGDQLTLTQKQFFIGSGEHNGRQWPVPLGAPGLPELLDAKHLALTYDKPDAIQLNQDDSAHFITHYDDELFNRLLADVKNGKLSTLGKVQLLHEQTLLTNGGILCSDKLIDLINVFQGEESEQVWDMISLVLAELKKFVETDKAAETALRKLAGDLARPLFNTVGWDRKTDEPEETTKLRGTLLGWMLYAKDKSAIAEAIERYNNIGAENLDPELRALIMGATVRHGDTKTVVPDLLSKYQSTPSPELQSDICSAVTSTTDEAIIQHLLTLVNDTKIVRTQDTIQWFVCLIRNRYGRTITWQWLRDNWQWCEQYFGDEKSLDAFPRYAAGALSTRAQLQEYTGFFTPMRNNLSLVRSIDMGIVDLTAHVDLIERDSVAVLKALKSL